MQIKEGTSMVYNGTIHLSPPTHERNIREGTDRRTQLTQLTGLGTKRHFKVHLGGESKDDMCMGW